jgi:hypothetical protein
LSVFWPSWPSAPAPKAANGEYISIIDVVDAANLIKTLLKVMKEEIEDGFAGNPNILKHIIGGVEAKIHEVSPGECHG